MDGRESEARAALERAVARTGADAGVIELAEREEMVYAIATGALERQVGLRLVKRASLSGLCVLSGETQRCEDSEKDPRVDAYACRRVGARSMIVAPLLRGFAVFGAVKVISSRPRAFGGGDLAVLSRHAAEIAAALR